MARTSTRGPKVSTRAVSKKKTDIAKRKKRTTTKKTTKTVVTKKVAPKKVQKKKVEKPVVEQPKVTFTPVEKPVVQEKPVQKVEKKSNSGSTLFIILIIAVICAVALYYASGNKSTTQSGTTTTQKPETQTVEVKSQEHRDEWVANKAKNEDYVGEIIFDSGLLNKSFVQAKSCTKPNGDLYKIYDLNGNVLTDTTNLTGNDVYHWKNWETDAFDRKENGGSVYLDYSHSLDGQNLTISGTYFSSTAGNDVERVKGFTPLEKLLDAANYETNKNMSLVLDNETRYYELAAVVIYDTNQSYQYAELCQFNRNNFDYLYDSETKDEGYNQKFIDFVNEVKLYDTSVNLEVGDRTVILKTEIQDHMNAFELCIFKEVKVETFGE